MVLHVFKTEHLKGVVSLPASKSYSIRAFIIAACGGRSLIKKSSDCKDAKVACKVAKSFGANVVSINQNSFEIQARFKKPNLKLINVEESGTVLRFLLPLISLNECDSTVVGKGSLIGRPNLFLVETLRARGVNITGRGAKHSIPIEKKVSPFKAGKMSIDGSISSQFISALLIATPLLEEDTVLKLTGNKLVSSDYILMTRQLLQKAGIRITKRSDREYLIKGQQQYKGLKNFTVPSDYGLAAFHMAAAALNPSHVLLKGNLKDDLIQADGHIVRIMKAMGVPLKKTSTSIEIKGPCVLKGGDFSLKDCPDLVPIVAILALFAQGKTRLKDIRHARVKESDRISDLKAELEKVGARLEESPNSLVIYPLKNPKENVILDPHNDHRLAMAFCVLGTKLGLRVKDIECSHKSYPGFVKDFKALGVKLSNRQK